MLYTHDDILHIDIDILLIHMVILSRIDVDMLHMDVDILLIHIIIYHTHGCRYITHGC